MEGKKKKIDRKREGMIERMIERKKYRKKKVFVMVFNRYKSIGLDVYQFSDVGYLESSYSYPISPSGLNHGREPSLVRRKVGIEVKLLILLKLGGFQFNF